MWKSWEKGSEDLGGVGYKLAFLSHSQALITAQLSAGVNTYMPEGPRGTRTPVRFDLNINCQSYSHN